MTEVEGVFCCANWEERSILGVERDLRQFKSPRLFIIDFQRFPERIRKNVEILEKIAAALGVQVEIVKVDTTNAALTWHHLYKVISALPKKSSHYLVDISTMPRDTTWTLFSLLEAQGHSVSFAYHKPERYTEENWLNADPCEPNLVIKQSGIAGLGLPTALLILTGFDVSRTKHLIFTFEPKIAYLGFQEGAQFRNDTENVKKHREELKCDKGSVENGVEIVTFELDAFSSDYGYKAIENCLLPLLGKYNVIAASLGPKLSAIALYQIRKIHPEIAFAYAASKSVHPNYSFGIGESVFGSL